MIRFLAYNLFAGALAISIGLVIGGAQAAHAQTLKIQSDATIAVQNGAVLDLENGTMDLGGAGSTATLDEQSGGQVNGGPLTATRTMNAPTSVNVAGLGAVLTAGADLGDVTITRGHTIQTAEGNESIARYYEIAPSQNNSGLDATLSHAYLNTELNGIPETELVLFKSTDGGTTWTREGVDSRDTGPAAGGTVTLSGIESFSRWTLASSSNPLPVELAGFEAQRSGSESVTLQWRTLSETNNAGFEVQRATASVETSQVETSQVETSQVETSQVETSQVETSQVETSQVETSQVETPPVETPQWDVSTGESWKTIAHLEGAGTTGTPQSYQFEDTDLPYAADRVRYRLRQIDTDGTESFSEPVTIARQVTAAELLPTYPNPARSQAMIRFATPERQDVRIALYDMLGRRVQTVVDTNAEGRTEAQLDVSNLASGTYFVRMQTDGFTDTQRLTVVR
ncbi:hypothetical protein CRI93_08235 [Longimonas halophila]|uniref:Secretion system C-terminal sorting domain-containing protein n=1 Tax=Longimonas halophila TaxID=1469170 RepID=A0A2H3NXY6_9BACT|nr:T9SS type A sorting domain-containing protein [Longimonas halophila]PEN07113.1 hypothetical protein CRI93_08235 [Longimonas halophila]